MTDNSSTPPNMPRKPSNFVNKVNALTPIFQLCIASLCVVLATNKPELWESQGFNIFLGGLGGSAATGTLTQKDEVVYYEK